MPVVEAGGLVVSGAGDDVLLVDHRHGLLVVTA
jgi:hypothetical protein